MKRIRKSLEDVEALFRASRTPASLPDRKVSRQRLDTVQGVSRIDITNISNDIGAVSRVSRLFSSIIRIREKS